MRKWFLGIGLLFITLLCLSIGMIHFTFSKKKYIGGRLPAGEHWIHKGLYDNSNVYENTIAAFDSARAKKISGIELDVYYIDSLNDFIVSHDMPNRFGLPALRLSEVLSRYDTGFAYWLDLKNLSFENKEQIAGRLNAVPGSAIRNKMYIESGNADALGYLSDQGFRTIYWIQYNRTSFLKKLIKTTIIKWNFIRYNFDGGSIGASLSDEDFFDEFAPVPKFIFHIYTAEIYEKLKKQTNIAVYLVDYFPSE